MKRALISMACLVLLALCPARAEASAPAYVELADAPIITVDWSKGITQTVMLHGDRRFIFANGQQGGKYLLIVKQDAVGSRTVTWPDTAHWPGLQAPTLTTTANKKDYITLFYDGVTYDLVGISQGF